MLFLWGVFAVNAQFENKQKNLIDVLSYEFAIKINDTTNRIEAKAINQIVLKKQTDSIYFDFMNSNSDGQGMKIASIRDSNGKNMSYKHIYNKLIINGLESYSRGDTLQLTIAYAGIPIDGLYIEKNMYGQRTFFGDNWPDRARYWLPVVDHPSDKALVRFQVTAPKHYKVIASGVLMSKTSVDSHTNRYDYQSKIALPTKVMVFAAADFITKQYGVVDQVPISSWIFNKAPAEGLDDYKPAMEIVPFYNKIIGPYDYKKLANVQSKTRFGGMENAGTIFYSENTIGAGKLVEPLLAHEIAHQWFGDSVTEENWSDIWLSEGFATYLTDLYLENKYGTKRLAERMKMEREKVIRYSKSKDVQPVVYREKKNLMKLLNRNSYEKGAWVLHMLRKKVGDASFFTILQSYYSKYRNKNASTSDFIQLSESVSGQDLQVFFQQWLYRKTIPQISVLWTYQSRKLTLSVTQLGDVYALEMPVKISDGKIEKNFVLSLDKQQQTFEYSIRLNVENINLLLDPNTEVLFENLCE